jgi:hypothetical protein
MTKLSPLLVLALAAAVAMPALAADTKSENKQNTKMADCQKTAGEKKLEGKDRQSFVNECLKAKPAKASTSNKMAECNAKTKGMTKEEAAKARSECMKAG